MFAAAMMATQPLINDFGEMFIAANFIVMRIDGFVIMPAFSFGNAMTVFAGQNVGAGKVERVGAGVKQAALLSFCTAAILITLALAFGRYIAGIFTDTSEVIDTAMRLLRILAIGHVTLSVSQVLWGAVRGSGDAMSPMWAALINSLGIHVPVAYLLVFIMGRPEAVIYALTIAWASGLLIALVVYRIGKWRTKGIM
jgi:Na+-driven multidrug efflux pump